MNVFLHALNRAAESWAIYVLHATWQASLLALVVLVLVCLRRQLNSHLRYALLLLALVKFIVPPFAAVPFGLFSRIPSTSVVSIAKSNSDRGQSRSPTIAEFGLDRFSTIPRHDLDHSRAFGVVTGHSAAEDIHASGATKLPTSDRAGPMVASGFGGFIRRVRTARLPVWLLMLHVAGSVALAFRAAREYRRLAWLSATASQVIPGKLLRMFESNCQLLGLRRRVTLRLSDEPISPMAFGIIQPVVLLPRKFVQQLSTAEQNGILAHELAHHRRCDHLVLCVQCVLVCIWWFNPLVWILSRAVNRCREECCDDRVLQSGLASCAVYCEALVRIAEYVSRQQRGRAMVRHAAPMHPLGARIARVMDTSCPRSAQLSVPATVAVVLLACFLFPGTPRGQTAAGAPAEEKSHAADAASASTTVSKAGQRFDLYGDPLPDGVIVRLGTIRFRHPQMGGPDSRVEFLGGGRYLVSTLEQSIRVWDRNSGKIIHEIDTGCERVKTFVVSKGGLRIATLAERHEKQSGQRDTLLQLWDWNPGRRTITKHWREPVDTAGGECLTFTPDGGSIVVAGGERQELLERFDVATLQFFDVDSERAIRTHAIPVGPVQRIAFSPRGDVMAIASRRGVWLWNWTTEVQPTQLDQPPNRPGEAVAFSPDGHLLATLSDERNGLRLWNVRSKELVHRFGPEHDDFHRGDVRFTSDGRYLIAQETTPSGGIQWWDVDTGQLVRTLGRGNIFAMSLSLTDDDQWLVSAGGQSIQVWNLANNKQVGEPFVGHESGTWGELKFTDDGQSIVTATIDGTARIWDAGLGRQQQIVRHDKFVRSAVFSPDGNLMATSGMDDVVALWDVESGRRVWTFAGHGQLGGRRDLQFSPDGNRLYSWGDDLCLRAWDVRTGEEVSKHAIRPSDIELVPSDDGWYRRKDDPSPGFSHLFEPRSGQFTSDATQLVVSFYGTIYFYDVQSGEETRKFRPAGHLEEVQLSADGTLVVTKEVESRDDRQAKAPPSRESSWSTYVRIRDFDTLRVRREIELHGRKHYHLAIAPNGTHLAMSESLPVAGSRSKWSINVFETDTGRQHARIRGSNVEPPSRLAFSPNANRIASGHENTTALLWDVERFRYGAANTNESTAQIWSDKQTSDGAVGQGT